METYEKQTKPTIRTFSSRSGQSQNDVAKVLQTYRNRTVQLAGLTEEDDTLVQGKFTAQLQGLEEEDILQRKSVIQLQENEVDELLQGKFTTQLQMDDELETVQQKSENRTGLPNQLKRGIENLSGYSLDAVKVHYNSPNPTQLQAYAYTQGTDIHVSPGQERYLPHEAWHVVQQMKGQVMPTAQLRGIAINDNIGLEGEADRMGEKAISLGKENSITQCYLKSFSPVNSANYPIQGGWGKVALASIMTLGGAATAALAPVTVPFLAATAGLVDVAHGVYSGYKAYQSDRYTIPAGTNLNIKNAEGTVDGENLANAFGILTSNEKMKVNVEINTGGSVGPTDGFVQESTGDKAARVVEAGFPMLAGLTAMASPFMGEMGASQSVADGVAGGSSGAYIGGHFTES